MAKTAQEKADLKAEKLYEKTHKNIYRTSVGDQIFNVINYVVYTLFTIICIFPFYYLFINTISDNDLVIKGLINLSYQSQELCLVRRLWLPHQPS